MTQEQWGQLQRKLLSTVGKNNYANWIEPLEFHEISEGVATFHVPTNFLGNYVAQNFGDLILHQLSEAGQVVRRVNFRVPANSAQRPTHVAAPSASEEVTPAVALSTDQLPGAPLDRRFTFDSFVVGKPNELAHAAARRVAEGGPVTFNPLFLYGGVGLGKTHLMHAIAWELQTKRPDLNVVYLSAEQFMYRFVQALRDRKMMDFKQIFRAVDVLMVDDVQFIAGKDSTQEEFFHTFNALVDGNKQIIISADRAPGEIKDLEDRIKSRLQCGLVVDLHPTDYELRLGILQSIFLPGFAQIVFPDAALYTQWDPQGRRLVSTFLDPNLAGGLIMVVLLLICARLVSGEPVPLWKPGLLVTALVITMSRSSILAFLVGLAVIGLLVRRVTWRALAGSILAIAVGLMAAPWLLRMADSFGKLSLSDGSLLTRFVNWGRALRVLADHPIVGVGFNTYGFVQLRYGFGDMVMSSFGLDGGLLFIAVMTGFVGVTLYSILLFFYFFFFDV